VLKLAFNQVILFQNVVWLVVWHFWYEWYVCIFCLWCRCTSVPSVSGPVLFSTTAPLRVVARSSPAIPCRVELIKIRVKYRHASTQRKEQNFDVFGGYHTTTPKFQLLKALNLWHPNTIILMLNSLVIEVILIGQIKNQISFWKILYKIFWIINGLL